MTESTKKARSLINKGQVKQFVFGQALTGARALKFTRISNEFYTYLDGLLRQKILVAVHQHPSVGKTIYPPIRVAKEPEPVV